MRRGGVIITFLTVVIIGLSIVQISLSNRIATDGSQLAQLDQQINVYKRQNILIQEQVLQASSLTNIEQKAEKLGFVEANSAIYLSTPLPLALKQ